jgi:hypothetical protein
MNVCSRRFGAALASLAVIGLMSSSARAQFQRAPVINPVNLQNGLMNRGQFLQAPLINPVNLQNRIPFNSNQFIAPGVTLQNYATSVAVLGRAYSNIPPYLLGYNPYPQTINPYATLSTVPYYNPYAVSPYAASLSTNPYTGGSGYSPGNSGYGSPYAPYSYDPTSGYLRGAADITTANAQYQLTIQQAKLVREQARQAGVDTQRKIYDEARYERMYAFDPEKDRQRTIARDLDRARNFAPLTDIRSGKALNDLYQHLVVEQGKGHKGPQVPLDEETLKNINLHPKDSRANVGLLKEDAKLQWPLSLEGPDYADARKRLTQLVADAVQQVKFNNPVEPGTLRDMRADLARLNETLRNNVSDMAPAQYITAQRYLNQVDDALRVLEDPKAANYFNQNWSAKGKNVAELIKAMSEKGLMFAPAVPGDEAAYVALYNAMVAFDNGMTQLTANNK